jgi:uncharacterized membrane protein
MQKIQKSIRALISAIVLSVIATAGWSQSLTWLGTLGGGFNWAYGVSADGSVVVGGAGINAFRWTASGGMEDLNTTYAHLLTNGSFLWTAKAISPNGRYIVGFGWNNATQRDEAFLLDTRLPVPPALGGCVIG